MERRASFNIPAQDLNSAVLAFAERAGIRVFYDVSRVQGLRSNGVTGDFTPAEALDRLLSGTGLTFRFTAANAVELEKLPQTGQLAPGVTQLDPVRVQGTGVPSQAVIGNAPPPYAGGQVATGSQLGLLGNRDLMDTPFNTTSYTAKKAQDQQAKTVKEVLVDDPSIRAQRRDGGPGDDNVYIRGFQVGAAAVAYGGLYGILPISSISSQIGERVEVLKGPSAMLNGMSPYGGFIGGTVNLVPKRAPNEDLNQVGVGYATAGQYGGNVDVARRFGGDKEVGVRLNGAYKSGPTDVGSNTDQRGLALLGLDFRGNSVRLSGDVGYQTQYVGGVIPYIGLAVGIPLPWAPDARTNQGPSWSFQERRDLFGVVRGEVDLTDNVTAYAAFGARDSRIGSLYSVRANITNFNGAAAVTAPLNLSGYTTTISGEAGLRSIVDTGPFRHEVALTASMYGERAGSGTAAGAGYASNVYNPTTTAVRPNIAAATAPITSTTNLTSYGLADTLSVAEKRIQLTLGGRLQTVDALNYDPVTGAPTTGYYANALSPSVALVIKPWQNVSLYGNWIQGLQQGATVATPFANAGEIFPPYKSTQYEAGIKVDWGKFTTTASLFQISQPSVVTDVVTNTQSVSGEQVNRGFELNFFGEVTEGVRLLGGLMLLDPKLTKTAGGATDNWIAPFSPGTQANVAAEYDLPFVPGLTVAGRVVYTSAQYIDTTLPRRSLPEWTRFDAGLRYKFDNPAAHGKPLVARLNAENLLGANYWEGGNAATTLFLGAPRSVRFSLTADF